MGGFGGVADRLNAYNVFRGDPSLITTDVERFQSVSAPELERVAARYLDGRPRVSLSVVGRKKAGRVERRSTARPRSPAPSPSRFRPPVPEIITLSCGIPLWVFPRRDLPTVAGSIVIAAGASLQQPAQAGLAQLTTVMLDEGTSSRTAEAIALAVESMGAAIDASCGWDGSYVSFRCLKADLLSILDLAVDILLNPTFPEAEWERVQGPDARGPQGGARQRRVTRVPSLLSALYPDDHPYSISAMAGHEASVASLHPCRSGEFSRAIPARERGDDRRRRRRRPESLAGELERPAAVVATGRQLW